MIFVKNVDNRHVGISNIGIQNVRENWIEFSRSYDEYRTIIVHEKCCVCSAHFVADSFNVYIKNTLLKPTAIPSLIIQRVCFVS